MPRHRADDLQGATRLRHRAHGQGGLSDRVEIKLLDYRDERGTNDAIASIEMFEAVGEEYWDTYFAQLKALTKPGGRAGLQVITDPRGELPVLQEGARFHPRLYLPWRDAADADPHAGAGRKHGATARR